MAAAAAGAGAPVVEYRPQDSLLVIGYIEGRTFGTADVAAPGNIPRIAAGVPPAALGRAVRQRLRHVRHPAAVPGRWPGPAASASRPDTTTCCRSSTRPRRRWPSRARRHGPVQQRPAGRELHRRRRPDLADRLRVLGQQRRLLRARQHRGRVPPVRRRPGRAGHRPTTGGRGAARSPGPGCSAWSACTGGRCGARSRTPRARSTSTSGPGRWNGSRARPRGFTAAGFGGLLEDVQRDD